ncbi:MAG: N-acetylmuramoyl-L-alanine amidase [marine bacterium B5-7]|nr:MAG: N-acetylmuramoyl-L-alanine amidase [marine bacterium B5-7]
MKISVLYERSIAILLMIVCAIISGPTLASVSLENVRMWHGPDKSRLVFDLSEPVDYNVYTLDNPQRLVIDLNDAIFRGALPEPRTSGPFIHKIRKGTPKPGVLRIVLDLTQAVDSAVLVLPPNEIYGHRLVIDIAARQAKDKVTAPLEGGSAGSKKTPGSTPRVLSHDPQRPITIAIDAGHGGEDPGAIGGRRTQEKQVVMEVAQRLVRLVEEYPGLRAMLTRKGDYYVSLRQRTSLARKAGADLFVSLHADGFYNRDARGMSVYALSNKGATSEAARWLADKENASDLVGGVSLNDKDDLLAQVLLDLSMTRAVSDGIVFARYVLEQLKLLGPVHSVRVEQAGFAVLKSPDIPSILVETGYITNSREEKLLRTRQYQQQLADAIFNGILKYLKTQELLPPPQNSGGQVHLVTIGDSLSMLALRYGVSVAALKSLNGLKDNRIFIGQKLKIPDRLTGNINAMGQDG